MASSISVSSRSCFQSLSGACQNSWKTCTLGPNFDADKGGDDEAVCADWDEEPWNLEIKSENDCLSSAGAKGWGCCGSGSVNRP